MCDNSPDSDSDSPSIAHSSGSDDNESENTDDGGLKLKKYQLELAEYALMGKNTIISAATGSGKTHVAMYIVKNHLDGASKGTRKVVFMAKTGMLIKQQSEQLKKYLPQYETRLVTSTDDRTTSINMFKECYDILCFTPQILVNSLEAKVVESLSEFSLLILDECHNARGDEPYSVLMRKYLVEKYNGHTKLPQIVGLTASVGIGNSRSAQESKEHILRLCACLDVTKISTVKNNIKSYTKHTHEAKEETIHLIKRTSDPCRNILQTAMKKTEKMLEENSLTQPGIVDLITEKQPKDRESQEYNKWTVEVMKAAQLSVDDNDISRDISSCAKYLNIYNSALEVSKLLRTKDIIKFLAQKHQQEGEHKHKLTDMEKDLYKNLIKVQRKLKSIIHNSENPNVRILSDTLREIIDDKGEDSRAMVFVKARATCRALAAFLDDDLQKIEVKASPLYGKESRAGDDGMTESVQTDVLEKFREGIYKVLVCTSVGNEGIDIPNCNIVLSYEYSGDEITKLQMKGRARKLGATAVTMGSEKIVEQEKVNAFKALMMYRALSDVEKMNEKQIELKIKPLQKEQIQMHLSKIKAMKYQKSNKTSEVDYDIYCGNCKAFACKVSDVRQLGHDRIVVNKEFENKIAKKEHKKPIMYDEICKKYKMHCIKCPLDWGIIGIKNGINCMILKIKSLKFKNARTGQINVYRKWDDMPYDVQKINFSELMDLLDRERRDEKEPEDCQHQSAATQDSDDCKRSDLETATERQAVDDKTVLIRQIPHGEKGSIRKNSFEHETPLKQFTVKSSTTSVQCLQTINDENQEQAKTRKRNYDSDDISSQTMDDSKGKVTQSQGQRTPINSETDRESITAVHLTVETESENSQGTKHKKRKRNNSKESKFAEKHDGPESCTSSLSRTGSSGYPFKKDQDDTLSQSMVDSLSIQMKSVGALVASGRTMGTVFRVGSRYVMTAGHVVKDLVDSVSKKVDNSVYVCFHESLLEQPRTVFLVNREVFKNLYLDVAVLEIYDSENELPQKMALSKDDAINTLHLEDVSFIGYGHPGKEWKHLDPRCKLVSPTSQRMKNTFWWLKENTTNYKQVLRGTGRDPKIVCTSYDGYDDSSKLLFDSFMQQGASGSPAVTNNDPRSVKVVGILTHGLPEFYFLLPKIIQPNVENAYRFELGSKMSCVYNAILESDKNLADDLFE